MARRTGSCCGGWPDASQAAQIAALLGTGMLTDKQRREVAFVAGLRLDRG